MIQASERARRPFPAAGVALFLGALLFSRGIPGAAPPPHLGDPVVTGSVLGVGASRNLGAVRWGVGANIVAAWLITIPASALIAWVAFAILHTAGLRG